MTLLNNDWQLTGEVRTFKVASLESCEWLFLADCFRSVNIISSGCFGIGKSAKFDQEYTLTLLQ